MGQPYSNRDKYLPIKNPNPPPANAPNTRLIILFPFRIYSLNYFKTDVTENSTSSSIVNFYIPYTLYPYTLFPFNYTVSGLSVLIDAGWDKK
jgi:hypothetical protein